MGDTTNYIPGSEGFAQVIDFAPYLDNVYNIYTGRRWEEVEQVYTLRDASGKPYEEKVLERKLVIDEKKRILNDLGGDYVRSSLEEFMNRHMAMGEFVTDLRCRQQAKEIAVNIFAELISNSSKYGISEDKYSMLEFRMDNTMRALYQYFTAMREGKLLAFGRETTGSQTTRAESQNVGPLEPIIRQSR